MLVVSSRQRRWASSVFTMSWYSVSDMNTCKIAWWEQGNETYHDSLCVMWTHMKPSQVNINCNVPFILWINSCRLILNSHTYAHTYAHTHKSNKQNAKHKTPQANTNTKCLPCKRFLSRWKSDKGKKDKKGSSLAPWVNNHTQTRHNPPSTTPNHEVNTCYLTKP